MQACCSVALYANCLIWQVTVSDACVLPPELAPAVDASDGVGEGLDLGCENTCPSLPSSMVHTYDPPNTTTPPHPQASLVHSGEALLHAAERSDFTLMRALLDRGVPVDAYGSVPYPPDVLQLQEACGSGAVAGACGAPPPPELETTALCVAARAGEKGLAMLRGLLSANADPTLEDSSGRTALHWATLADCAHSIRALLSAGAHAAQRGPQGKSAVHMAAARGSDGALRVLLEGSGDSTVESSGDSAVRRQLLDDEASGEGEGEGEGHG